MKTCLVCNNPLGANRQAARFKFCGRRCANKHNNKKKKELTGVASSALRADNAQVMPITQSDSIMSSTEQYLYREKISELKETIAKLETVIERNTACHQAVTKEKELELKGLTKEHNELQVKHNTITQAHTQELNGLEQDRRSMGREFLDLIKDKDAMGNVLDAVAAFRGNAQERGVTSQIAGAEGEDVQAVRTLYSKLGHEHQKMFVNSLYIYSKRPDLLEKQALELEQIINGA